MLRFWKRNRRDDPERGATPSLFAAPPRRFERLFYLEAAAVVAAKLAKCDGPVRRPEVDAFKRQFPLTAQEQSAVGPLFNLARESPEGFEPFAAEIMRMLGDNEGERQALFARFIRVAEADGPLNREECQFLDRLAVCFRVEAEWERFHPSVAEEEADPYAVLGVDAEVSDEELRTVWQRLIRRFHPDAAAARGETSVDHTQVATINAAYRRIRRSRWRKEKA